MKNLLVLAVATLFAANASAAEMKWNGSAGWRYTQTSNDDNLESKDNATNNKDVSTQKTRAHQMRANLGVMGGWEHVEYGFGVRTNNLANDDYSNVQQNGDLGLGIEQAWFRYVRDFGSLDLGLTIGRQKAAFAYDSNWETLFDNDVRWDGFGWNFKFGMFGLNASQYVLGAKSKGVAGASTYTSTASSDSIAASQSRFSMLYSFQPYMKWKFADEIEAMFAVAYHKWIDEGANTNQIGGGVPRFNTGTVTAVNQGVYKMDNASQWDFLAEVSLPYNLNFTGDLVKANKASYTDGTVAGWKAAPHDVSSTAWTLGLTYGKLRKAQDFTIGYAYGTKGIGSVINTFTNEKFLADNKGHTVVLGYAMADNFHLGFRWMSLQEKELIDTSAGANQGLAYGGTTASQKMKTNYWELNAGVAF